MLKTHSIFHKPPESLEEKYFAQVRPKLYELHGKHSQYGTRKNRSLAEHLDSACQFVLTVSEIAKVPEDKRGLILAATAVHDLNKLLDNNGRNVKILARDGTFLQAQLKQACVAEFVKTDEEVEIVRRLVERHSGHNSSDGMRFLPEDNNIKCWAAMLIGGDLFDLGIEEEKRISKVETELTVALQKDSHLYKISLAEDRGYLTSLLLSACEEVLHNYGLHTLAIEPDGQLFVGESFPQDDLTREIAQKWQRKIDSVFGGNVKQLVRATKDGIKVDAKAIQENVEETLDQVDKLLVKKSQGYKLDKVSQDIQKYSEDAGKEAVIAAENSGLNPVTNAEEFAISEGLKATYLSYRRAGLNPKEVWDCIAQKVGFSPQQRAALEPFNPQYGRCLFAAKAVNQGLEGVYIALEDSFALRKTEDTTVSDDLTNAVRQLLNTPNFSHWESFESLTAYIEGNPRQRCSLGTTSGQIEELISNKMPPGTKVQAFSNRLPGGMSAEPKRRGNILSALGYQLMAVGANFPKVVKQDPLYLHFALPKGSNRALQTIWRNFLQDTSNHNENGVVTIDELQLYRNNEVVFKAHKSVGMALPKRTEFIHSTVTIPVVWGDVNSSIALLKSLRLGLELSLALDVGFPLLLSANLEVESNWDIFVRVEGIPSSLQPLLGTGKYQRDGYFSEEERAKVVTAETVLIRLRCLGKLAISVASLQKKDDCLYDLARAISKPFSLYHVLLRWVLREQNEPNLEAVWNRLREPLNTLLQTLMSPEHEVVSYYLKQAAQIAEEGKLRGSSFRRTAQTEPFSEFIKAVRTRKSHMDWETIFAALTQQYHTRLDRIRKYKIGATKFEQVKAFYQVLKQMFDEVYNYRPERLLSDSKTLEAAYLFFLQEARQELKQNKTESETNQEN